MTATAQAPAHATTAIGPTVVAVDCSTTGAKALVVDARGTTVSQGRAPLATATPRPGWHEQRAGAWWEATREAVRQALTAGGQRVRDSVEAICLTHQRESFACLGADGAPLRPALLWLDGRARTQIAALGTARVEEVSGKPADITPALYKLAWLRENEPAVMDATERVVDVHAALAHALVGRWISSTASADSLGLFDVRAAAWSPELLDLVGLSPERLPDLVPAGTVIGPLLPQVAADLGLSPRVRLVAGLGDGQAAGLGAGATEPGTAYLNLGTAVVLGAQAATYRPSRAYRTLVSGIPGQLTLEAFISSGTYLPAWFRERFGRPELAGRPDPDLEAAAAALPPGSDGLLTVPYWNAAQTPHWDPDACGAVVGWHGGHGPAHVYRSLMEGIALEIAAQVDGIEAATGQHLSRVVLMGGGSRSALWRQVVADVLGRSLVLARGEETSALGAAMVAMAAIGVHDGPAAASTAMSGWGATVTPLPSATARYAALATPYRSLYRSLAPVMHQLAVLR